MEKTKQITFKESKRSEFVHQALFAFSTLFIERMRLLPGHSHPRREAEWPLAVTVPLGASHGTLVGDMARLGTSLLHSSRPCLPPRPPWSHLLVCWLEGLCLSVCLPP